MSDHFSSLVIGTPLERPTLDWPMADLGQLRSFGWGNWSDCSLQTSREAQTTGGGTPWALAARSGSQLQTMQAC